MDILQKDNITPEQILRQLRSYITKKQNVAWTEFAEAGSGEAILQAISAVGGLLNFNLLMLERESNVTTMSSYDSAIVICNLFGYPVGRKTSPVIKLNINVTQTMVVSRYDTIGYMNDYPIVPFATTVLTQGDNELLVTLGSFEKKTWEVQQTDDFYSYYVEEPNQVISNQINELANLKINGSPVDLVLEGGDLNSVNALCLTVVGGVLLIFGDGNTGYAVNVNDVMEFEYLKAVGFVDFKMITNTSFIFYLQGKTTLNSFEVMEAGYQEDDFRKLITLAPTYSAARRRMITYRDFEVIVTSEPGIVSCKYAGRQNPKGYEFIISDERSIVQYMEEVNKIYLSYIYKPDPDYNSPEELIGNEQTFIRRFDENIILGTFIDFEDPELVYVSIMLSLVMSTNADVNAIKQEILEKARLLTLNLGGVFRLSDLDAILADIPEIKRYVIHTPYSDCDGMPYTQYLKLGRVWFDGFAYQVEVGDIDIVFTTDTSTMFQYQTSVTGYFKYDETNKLRMGFWNYSGTEPEWYWVE